MDDFHYVSGLVFQSLHIMRFRGIMSSDTIASQQSEIHQIPLIYSKSTVTIET